MADGVIKERKCIRCLLREMAEADLHMIEKYKKLIKEEDRVCDVLYEQRLQICKECDKLNDGTCSACGCYVELRALGNNSSCPHHMW